MWLNRQIEHGWFMDNFGKFNVEYCKFQFKEDIRRKDIEARRDAGEDKEDYLKEHQFGFIIKKVQSFI